MKAIRVHEAGGPEVLKLEEVPDLQPKAGEVLVRIHAAGVNPVDTYFRQGGVYQPPAYPYTPGLDGAGVIESVGEGVPGRLRPGQRVYVAGSLTGTYAEQALCRPDQVYELPERLSFAQGAAVYVNYATAWRALMQKARGVPGETVLVHGASGGVGVAAVQIARAAGFTVIGTAGTERGRDLVRREGAHHVLDHRCEGYLDQVRELTGGKGVDVILEMLANVNLGHDLPLLARGGRVVVIGSRGTVEINPRDLMARDATVTGMVLMMAPDRELLSAHAALGAGLANGTLTPVIGREFALAEAAQAHVAVMEPGAYGKIVLKV